jgi:hypothetical protein
VGDADPEMEDDTMRRWNAAVVTVLAVGTSVLLIGCGPREGSTGRVLGWSVELGNGTVTTHTESDNSGTPTAIGVVYSADALEGLATEASDHHRCFDRDGDGAVDKDAECLATHEVVIPLPDAVAKRADVPFKWVLLNWNPMGHIPPGVYDVPHFDIHFYMEPIANVFALHDGPCGPEFIRCDQYELAKKPVPPNYMHPDFQDVDAVVPAMGNHLIDLTGPEFNGEEWTRSWIFGTYDGRVIFYEEMVTRAFLLSRPDSCYPIKTPPAVGRSGLYPTQSCIRYDADTGQYTVSMEEFVLREASAPEPVAG